MKEFFKYFGASLLAFIVGNIFISIAAFLMFFAIIAALGTGSGPTVTESSILLINFSEPVMENPAPEDEIGSLVEGKKIKVSRYIQAINEAAKDEKIKGIYLDLTNLGVIGGLGFSAMNEIEKALAEFRKTGKPVYAYSEYLDERAYFLASAADSIFFNPVGMCNLNGIAAEIEFYRQMMDKIGVQAQIFRQGRYKSAVEPFSTDRLSPENREQIQHYVSVLWKLIREKIAANRKISPDSLSLLADNLATLENDKLVKYRIVDKIGYAADVRNSLASRAGMKSPEKLKFISVYDYINASGVSEYADGGGMSDEIAVIYVAGDIINGSSVDDATGDKTVIRLLRNAAESNDVKAIVVRVSSPGGSAIASENIWREIKTVNAVKPVVISMGDYAASGGYYLSAGASRIVTEPGTLTGSIGVFAMLVNFKELLNNKIGITTDTVKSNRYSDYMSVYRPASEFEILATQRSINSTYLTFLQRVSEGRKMSVERVDSIAQGRVWTGIDAVKLGLADTLGSFGDAVKIAAELGGTKSYSVVNYTPRKSFTERLFNSFESQIKTLTGAAVPEVVSEGMDKIRVLERLKGAQTRMTFNLNLTF